MKVRNIDKLRVSEFKNAAAKLEEENVKGPFNAGIDLESFSVLIKDPEFEAAYKNAYRDQPVQPDKIIHDANLARNIILAGGKDQILLDATRDLVPKLSATILMLSKALEIMSKSIADALQAQIPEDSEMKKAMADQWKFIIQQCIDEAMGRPVVAMEYEDFEDLNAI
ncbi:unnamed protein product [Sphagnum compactum]